MHCYRVLNRNKLKTIYWPSCLARVHYCYCRWPIIFLLTYRKTWSFSFRLGKWTLLACKYIWKRLKCVLRSLAFILFHPCFSSALESERLSFPGGWKPPSCQCVWGNLVVKAVVAHARKHCRLWQFLRPLRLVYNANGTETLTMFLLNWFVNSPSERIIFDCSRWWSNS